MGAGGEGNSYTIDLCAASSISGCGARSIVTGVATLGLGRKYSKDESEEDDDMLSQYSWHYANVVIVNRRSSRSTRVQADRKKNEMLWFILVLMKMAIVMIGLLCNNRRGCTSRYHVTTRGQDSACQYQRIQHY